MTGSHTPPALHRPRGSAKSGQWEVSLTQAQAGWDWSSLRVLALEAGQSVEFWTGDDELIVLPLAGSCVVSCQDQVLELAGRPHVFAGVSDFAYVPRHATVHISAVGDGGRYALPGARADHDLPVRYGPASGVPIELRGAGNCSRQVNNFATDSVFECDRLIACEVITPAGNWSSYPPHKHDEDRPGESVLEEIYYFELADGGRESAAGHSPRAIGYHRVYGTPDRPIDVLAEVRSGDVVLVPHGWHGPAMAVPGYDLYYLNVMAGPGERRWLICDDPVHGWVRDTWHSEEVDPRLPFYRSQP